LTSIKKKCTKKSVAELGKTLLIRKQVYNQKEADFFNEVLKLEHKIIIDKDKTIPKKEFINQFAKNFDKESFKTLTDAGQNKGVVFNKLIVEKYKLPFFAGIIKTIENEYSPLLSKANVDKNVSKLVKSDDQQKRSASTISSKTSRGDKTKVNLPIKKRPIRKKR